ncbi:MAG: ribosome recycling factor [Epsilonproteobacteria bacterium]|nr:ribosome recycling factor [Campylobacterota bacterium]
MSVNEIHDKAKSGMQKSIESLKKDFTTLRTGKVSTAILDNIKIDYYGTPTALNQVATVLATDATTITISPWEKNMLKEIEKAIQSANLGVNPNNDGENVKLFFPPMTIEQREENVKKAKAMVEKAKVAIRNIRKDANNKIKALEKDKEITEDESKRAHDDIQKLTDEFTSQADSLLKSKEAELMKV